MKRPFTQTCLERLRPVVEWLKRPSTRRNRRAWIVSAAVHLVLLLVLAQLVAPSVVRSAGMALDCRLVGDSEPVDWVTVAKAEPPSPPSSLSVESVVPTLQELPKLEVQFPEWARQGAGAPLGDLVGKPSGKGQDGSGSGGAGFFGVGAAGRRFAYVVDMSSSMSGPRFQRAQQELLRSISELREDQRFFVVFFSDQTYPLFFPQPVKKMVRATPGVKSRVEEWIKKAVPGGGTYPLDAVLLALSLEPDAVFLLSDGLFEPTTVTVIRRKNGKRAVIHTIGFEDPAGERLLQALADQNGGVYRFVP